MRAITSYQRGAHIGADRELEVDEGAAGVGEGLDFLQAREAAERLLLGLDQFGFDLGRRRGAPAREDRDDRLFHVREQLHRELDQADDAQHDDQADADGDADRALQGFLGEVHAAAP